MKSKSGEVVVDQNIKIAIAVITLIVILSGVIYFFGDKIDTVLSNFLPQYDTPVGDQEIVLSGTDSKVVYGSRLIDIGERDLNSQMTYEEKNGLLEKDVDRFYQNIFDNFLILSFSKSGNEILKLKSFAKEEIDPDSKTNPVRILFNTWDTTYIDFVYDAQRKEVLFGNANTGVFYSKQILEPSNKAELDLVLKDPEFKWLLRTNMGFGSDMDHIKIILDSTGLDNFEENLVKIIDKEQAVFGLFDNQFLVNEGQELSVVPGIDAVSKKNYITNILLKDRPYYLSSWGMKGTLTGTKDLTYSCNIKGSWTDCKKENNQFYCRVGYVQSEDYRNDCIFVLFQLNKDDSILYTKGSEIWMAKFDNSPQLACYRGILEGSRCSSN